MRAEGPFGLAFGTVEEPVFIGTNPIEGTVTVMFGNPDGVVDEVRVPAGGTVTTAG